MDLINRYVYAVTRSFARKQREDIEKELRANIEDMVEQDEGLESYEQKVEKVLLELGDPRALADGYRGSQSYLIGPRYYETYIMILKIVFGAVFIGISIATFIGGLFTAGGYAGKIAADYFAMLFSGIVQAFAWTTISFVIVERSGMKLNEDTAGKSKWSPSQLPEVPDKKAVIPLSDSIFSIIFSTIFYTTFIVLLYSAPGLFAAYISHGGEMAVVPIFNPEVLQGYRILFIGVFVLSILREMLKLYYRRWLLKLSVLHVALTIASTALALVIFTDSSIWNADFPAEVVKYANMTYDFPALWEKIKSWFVAVIVLAGAIEITTALYKGIRYNTKR